MTLRRGTFRSWAGLFVALGACSIAGCGGKTPAAKAVEASDNGRSHGFSKDDKARCEWEGRADREVSEATAAGAFQPNIRRVYQVFGQGSDRRKVLICREVDTNLDGVKDVLRTFNDHGESAREEADTDYNGTVDSWTTYGNGHIVKQELDTNGDGKPDVWEIYVRGALERVGVDIDFDGRVDRWDRDESARVAQHTKDSDEDKSKSDADAGESNNDDADAGTKPQ